ncbi:MAG: ABC transporter ATP-binding protein [Bacteroidetes bacterium]|nr:ABC transporter ATP-binding protein [Bacteroidota bacterium]
MIVINDLDIGFKEKAPIFSKISVKADPGDIIALLGVNGVGKSTFLRTLCGVQEHLHGEIFIAGESTENYSAPELATMISAVWTEKIYIENITVREFIAMGRTPYTGWFGNLSEEDYVVIDMAITTAKLEDMEYRLFNHLSDGEKQRVLIARAICQDTPILILDEPTAYLDFRHKKSIYELLTDRSALEGEGVTIFSTHDIQAAMQYANTFWLMTEEKEFVVVKNTEPEFRQIIMDKLKIQELV